MDRICLTLPTNRACGATIRAMAGEAEYAARRFGVEVALCILDTCEGEAFLENARAVREIARLPAVIPMHLGADDQRRYFQTLILRAGVDDPELILDLTLPPAVSYGACTNRAFLLSIALGCRSIHRRDSDSRYQMVDGQKIFPIHHELLSLGKRAGDARHGVSHTALEPQHQDRPVTMVGSSFIGELSIDLGEMRELDQEVYAEVVGLWGPSHCTGAQRRLLVDESFTGAGRERFTQDRSTLAIVDPMAVDMCNVSFFRVHEELPLPPARDTIGTDYFLLHTLRGAQLPGVHHNRHIENFYTGERRTAPGFVAYQLRFIKFLLSMHYLHDLDRKMLAQGDGLLDDGYRLRTSRILDVVRDSACLDQQENRERLGVVDRAYRKLGGRYALVADVVASQRELLLDQAAGDMHEYALLIETWPALVEAARSLGPPRISGRGQDLRQRAGEVRAS
jgi:hypothetical protein